MMQIQKKQVLVFGYGLPVILIFLAWRIWAKFGSMILPAILCLAAVVILVTTVFSWERIVPIYRKWMAGVHLIGMIVTTILLSVVFYGMFGATGIILRILRKDLLDQKIDPAAKSYWHLREKKPFDPTHYTRQF